MLGFYCEENHNISLSSLEEKMDGDTLIFSSRERKTCCSCGKLCKDYIKICKKIQKKKEKEMWVVINFYSKNENKTCIIGDCCFDPSVGKFKPVSISRFILS